MADAATQFATQAATNANQAVINLANSLQETHINRPDRVTLPSFWLRNPKGWFFHAEAVFATARVPQTSHLAYLEVIKALPEAVLDAVYDVTSLLTNGNPEAYTILKGHLITRYTASALENTHRLIDLPPLGDGRASALAAQMQSLCDLNPNILLNTLFLRKLPAAVRPHLSERIHLPLRDLAAAADLVLANNPELIAAATPATPLIAAATTPRRQRSRSPTPFRGNYSGRNGGARSSGARDSRGFSPHKKGKPLPQPPSSSDLCVFHFNFGSRAHRCVPPCGWRGN